MCNDAGIGGGSPDERRQASASNNRPNASAGLWIRSVPSRMRYPMHVDARPLSTGSSVSLSAGRWGETNRAEVDPRSSDSAWASGLEVNMPTGTIAQPTQAAHQLHVQVMTGRARSVP